MRSLSNEELVILIKNGENEAYNMLKLWKQNEKLIYKFAKKYTGFAELCDLMQEAYLGLCEAVRFFDCSKGFAFTTYLRYWIKHKITRYIDECCHTIRIPSNTAELIYSNFAHRFCLCTLKIQYLAGIRLSKFTLCPMPPEAVSSTKQAMCS